MGLKAEVKSDHFAFHSSGGLLVLGVSAQ